MLCNHRSFAVGNGPSTKTMILDENPKRKSWSVYNNVTVGNCLIYLSDQAYPVVNLGPGDFFTMNETDDGFYDKVFAYDSAGLSTLYVTEISKL